MQDVNGWPQGVIAQYYQVILNMAPLPWQKVVSEPYWTAQFKHKLKPAEPHEPPHSQQLQGAGHSQSHQDVEPEQLLEAAGAEMAQPCLAGRYCKSILAHIDPQSSMADSISQHLAMDLDGSDLSDLEGLRDIISKRLVIINQAYAAQDETVTMLMQDLENMNKEQAALIELRSGTIEAQERVDARAAQKKEEEMAQVAQKKKEEEMAQAQEELRKQKEEQAQQILNQLHALGLSPEALLELHQKRQAAAVPSEAASAESESCGPATKKARLEEPQQPQQPQESPEMVEVSVEEEIDFAA